MNGACFGLRHFLYSHYYCRASDIAACGKTFKVLVLTEFGPEFEPIMNRCPKLSVTLQSQISKAEMNAHPNQNPVYE